MLPPDWLIETRDEIASTNSELMQRARVVLTPGRDFGQAQPQRYLRFSTASAMAQLQEAINRLEAVLG